MKLFGSHEKNKKKKQIELNSNQKCSVECPSVGLFPTAVVLWLLASLFGWPYGLMEDMIKREDKEKVVTVRFDLDVLICLRFVSQGIERRLDTEER